MTGSIIQDTVREVARENGGKITPQLLVDTCKPAVHKAHGYFDWDNGVAGPRWRLYQARGFIASVPFISRREDVPYPAPFAGPIRPPPAFVRDPDGEPGVQGYQSLEDIRNDPASARRAVANEIKSIIERINRLRSMAGAIGLLAEADLLLVAAVDFEGKI